MEGDVEGMLPIVPIGYGFQSREVRGTKFNIIYNFPFKPSPWEDITTSSRLGGGIDLSCSTQVSACDITYKARPVRNRGDRVLLPILMGYDLSYVSATVLSPRRPRCLCPTP